MTIEEFWEQIDVAVTHCHNCDICPVKIFADETGTELICCDMGNDCADSLIMLHKKLQKMNNEHEIDCMNKVNVEELEQVCRPVVEYMKKNCSPHETIVITDEQFKIVADTIVIPTFRLNSDTDVKRHEENE